MNKIVFIAAFLSVNFVIVQGTSHPVYPDEFNCLEQPTFGEDLNFPVPGDCTSFYSCSPTGDAARRVYCDEDLVYNPDTNLCDYPENLKYPMSILVTKYLRLNSIKTTLLHVFYIEKFNFNGTLGEDKYSSCN